MTETAFIVSALAFLVPHMRRLRDSEVPDGSYPTAEMHQTGEQKKLSAIGTCKEDIETDTLLERDTSCKDVGIEQIFQDYKSKSIYVFFSSQDFVINAFERDGLSLPDLFTVIDDFNGLRNMPPVALDYEPSSHLADRMAAIDLIGSTLEAYSGTGIERDAKRMITALIAKPVPRTLAAQAKRVIYAEKAELFVLLAHSDQEMTTSFLETQRERGVCEFLERWKSIIAEERNMQWLHTIELSSCPS